MRTLFCDILYILYYKFINLKNIGYYYIWLILNIKYYLRKANLLFYNGKKWDEWLREKRKNAENTKNKQLTILLVKIKYNLHVFFVFCKMWPIEFYKKCFWMGLTNPDTFSKNYLINFQYLKVDLSLHLYKIKSHLRFF